MFIVFFKKNYFNYILYIYFVLKIYIIKLFKSDKEF